MYKDLNRNPVVLDIQKFLVSWYPGVLIVHVTVLIIFPFILFVWLCACWAVKLGLLVCSGETGLHDGSGPNSVCQWELNTLPPGNTEGILSFFSR